MFENAPKMDIFKIKLSKMKTFNSGDLFFWCERQKQSQMEVMIFLQGLAMRPHTRLG